MSFIMKRFGVVLLSFTIAFALSLSVSGCNSDGGGEGGGASDATLSGQVTGTAATGAAMAGAQVLATGAKGHTRIATAGADGIFSIDVTGLTAPVLLKATYEGVSYYSFADAPGRANITPLSHMAVAMALGEDPSERQDSDPLPANFLHNAQDAAERINAKLDLILFELGVTGFDLLASEFAADGSGFDALLDSIQVGIAGGQASMSTISSSTNLLVIDLTTGEDTADKSDAQIAVDLISEGLVASSDASGLTEFLAELMTEFNTATPGSLASTPAFSALLATDYMSYGEDKAGALADLDEFPPEVRLVDFRVVDKMRDLSGGGYQFTEYGGHDSGYWVYLGYELPGSQRTHWELNSAVMDGTTWLAYGNRYPLPEPPSMVSTVMRHIEAGTTTYFTGLEVSAEDDVDDSDPNNLQPATPDIVAVVFLGPGLPDAREFDLLDADDVLMNPSELTLERDSESPTSFAISNGGALGNYIGETWGASSYTSPGYSADNYEDGTVYRVVFVDGGDDIASVSIEYLTAKPLSKAEVRADPSALPSIVQPRTLADLREDAPDYLGFHFEYQRPAGTVFEYLSHYVYHVDGSGQLYQLANDIIENDGYTHADTSFGVPLSLGMEPSGAELELSVEDRNWRSFKEIRVIE